MLRARPGFKGAQALIICALLIMAGLFLTTLCGSPQAAEAYLPMHIPVLLVGFLLPLPFALGTAAAVPVLNSLISGTPALWPMLPVMLAEFIVYVLEANLTYRKCRLNIYLALCITILCGRAAAAVAIYAVSTYFGADIAAVSSHFASAIMNGWPGILIQLALIPPLVMGLGALCAKKPRARANAVKQS